MYILVPNPNRHLWSLLGQSHFPAKDCHNLGYIHRSFSDTAIICVCYIPLYTYILHIFCIILCIFYAYVTYIYDAYYTYIIHISYIYYTYIIHIYIYHANIIHMLHMLHIYITYMIHISCIYYAYVTHIYMTYIIHI